jgi:hypothetical protein
MPNVNDVDIYRSIARNLREFGYPGVSVKMVREIHEAMRAGEDLPHGIIGMFASDQLTEALGDPYA